MTLLSLLVALLAISCGKQMISETLPVEYVQNRLAQFAPVNMTCDLSHMPDAEIQVVKLLVKAAEQMNTIFMLQVYENNLNLLDELKASPELYDPAYLDLFQVMMGPWDRLEENKPFLNTLAKAPGANFYPSNITKDDIEHWLSSHPEDRAPFESEYTIIRRKGSSLAAIPYSEYFKDRLKPTADLLRKAANQTSDQSLKIYLTGRAEALLSNDYYQSDMDWMDLSGNIEVVIGPYEVYEDHLFGYKAAYESFVCVVDADETRKLQEITQHLKDMEANLPIPDAHKNFNRGSTVPIKVVNEVYNSGDARAGVQTIAFNLPNDERVREAKGFKNVLLKNVMRAKFDNIMIPIASAFLEQQEIERVSFDGFFTHTLMHEISHGLGPGNITVNGRETTVRAELKELYSVIEECKADVLANYNTQFLINQGVLPKSAESTLYATYLGGMFRSIRFGIDEAHGGGTAIQLNWCLDKGGFERGQDGRFSVNRRRLVSAIRELARELLIIQATGDYAAASDLVSEYRVIDPDIGRALASLEGVPVDIRPIFPIEKEID